jgi:hypothetical protein
MNFILDIFINHIFQKQSINIHLLVLNHHPLYLVLVLTIPHTVK